MTLVLHHSPTKTEMEAIKRRRKFRALIAERANRLAVIAPVIVEETKPPLEFISPQGLCLRDWLFVATGGDTAIPNMARSIQAAVCREFQVTRKDLIGQSRCSHFVIARQVSMWLCKSFTKRSLYEIGRFHGGRDHSTAHHAIEKISRLVLCDDDLAKRILNLRSELEGYFNGH